VHIFLARLTTLLLMLKQSYSLQGSGSWKPGMDVQLIHTPGHTEVSCWILCLLVLLIHTLCLVKGMWGEEKEWGKDASVRLWTHLVGREEMKGLIFLNLWKPSFKKWGAEEGKKRDYFFSFFIKSSIILVDLDFFPSFPKRNESKSYSFPFPFLFPRIFFSVSISVPCLIDILHGQPFSLFGNKFLWKHRLYHCSNCFLFA